jgi:hypothetical protein
MNDRCPKCGADRVIGPGGVKVWRCGYCPDEEDGFRETWACLRRQRDQLEDKLARVEELVDQHTSYDLNYTPFIQGLLAVFKESEGE